MDIDISHKLPLLLNDTLLAESAQTIALLQLTLLVSRCLACSAFAPLGLACGNVQGSRRSLYCFSPPTGDLFLCTRPKCTKQDIEFKK